MNATHQRPTADTTCGKLIRIDGQRAVPMELIYEGAIVHVPRFPFHEDPSQSKPRLAVIVLVEGNQVTVRGIYSRPYRQSRSLLRATYQTGLHHDSYVDRRPIRIGIHWIDKYVGDAPLDFDLFEDMADVTAA